MTEKVSSATVAMILAIALYFTLFWGFDALRILTSPTFGLEDVWRSQYVFGIGRVLGLAPMGLIQLAAFFGTLKLASPPSAPSISSIACAASPAASRPRKFLKAA